MTKILISFLYHNQAIGEYHSFDTLPVPRPIMNLIKKHARLNAAKDCQHRNLQVSVTNLQQDLEAGTIPKHLEFKFKKLYNKPEELAIKSALIQTAITQEIAKLQAQMATLKAEYDQRLPTLQAALLPTITACDYSFMDTELPDELEALILSFKTEFILKQTTDAQRKEEKRLKFLAYKEVQDAAVSVTTKDMSGINSKLKSLQKQVTQLTSRQGKAKGAALKSPQRTPSKPKPKPKSRSTGTGKSKGGKPNATAKPKKSRGKNGKRRN